MIGCSIIKDDDLVPAAWMDGKEGMSVHAWAHRHYESGKTIGRRDKLQEVIDYLSIKVGKLFCEEKDTEAKFLREIIKEVAGLKDTSHAAIER